MTDIADEMNLFDSINSGSVKSGSDVAIETTEPITQEPPRDEAGKFTKVETPTNAQETTQSIPATTEEPEGKIPVAAVQDERRKRQDAERRAAELEQQLAELKAKSNTPVNVPAQQPQPVDFWSAPEEFVRQTQAPVAQQMAELREMMMEQQAMARHSPEVVQAAKEAALQLAGKPEGVALFQEVMHKGGNQFDTLVDWHKRQQTIALVGNDVEAFRAAEREKLLADPAFLAQAMERARANSSTGNSRQSAPRVSLPSLSNIPASGGSNAIAEQQSDGDLFASATTARRRK